MPSDLFPPIVRHLSATNDPPSDFEMSTIVEALRDAELQLSAFVQDDNLGEGNELAEEEAVERDRLQSFLQEGNAILSPVRRLPRELLEMVMERGTGAVSLNGTTGPWIFTRVSRFWRETAIGLPILWKDINDDACNNYATRSGALELVKLILARSGKISFSVRLSRSGYDGVLQMLDMSTRLTSLSLQGSTHHPVILCLPNLRRLAISDGIISISGKFPELRELFLHENFDRTWRHIVDNILSTSINLQFLTLSEWGHCTSFYSDPLLRILKSATGVTPLLKVLRLYPRGRPYNQNQDAIFSLIARLTLGHVNNNLSPSMLPNLANLILHLPKELAYEVRLVSGRDMKQEIFTRASKMGVSLDIQRSRLRRIWIQDGDCRPWASKLEKVFEEHIIGGVEVCIARPLVPAFGWEVGLADFSSSGEVCSALTNYA